MNPVVIIPAYNPPKSFKQLISTINTIRAIPIIVVDDGSDPIINLEHDNVTLLRNIVNKGKGYSLKKSFYYASTIGYTHAITLDADSQHDPKLLDIFLDINEDIIIVLGRRDFNNNMPIHRKLSNKLTSFIISYICNQNVYDSQCGYRRYKLSHLCSATYIENGFQLESEVLIKLIGRENSSLVHVNIPTIYKKEPSSINNLLDTLKFIRLVLRSIFFHKIY